MTISLDKTTLTTITRPNFTFSQETITASTDTSEGDEDFEEINSVTAVINQTEDNVTITGGDTSVSIVGTYANPFSDTFTYVDGDSSDKLMTPITVVSEDNVPEDKIFFTLSQDTSASVNRTYTVTVTYNESSTETFTVTHTINNEFDAIKTFVDTYYD
tara:strand:- start:68 stop:544 length:477 start_codon:yes stop_codon:yes gene_type:complete